LIGEVDPRWHAHVEIDQKVYKELREELLRLGVYRSAEKMALEFYRLPIEPYAPVRRQRM
jgi:hypothetical protein